MIMHVEDFKSILSKLRPVIGELADAFWLTTLLDPSQQNDIHAVAQAMAAQLLEESYTGKHILLEPPPGKYARGPYPMGTVIYAKKSMGVFSLDDGDFPQHLLILGRSGAGKTNVGYLVVRNLLQTRKPFIVFDWRKSYEHFTRRAEGKDLILFTPGGEESLSFNPLAPPPELSGIHYEAYLRDIISVVCTSYLPGHHLLSTRGVEYLFLKATDHLKRVEDKPLTFNAIREFIEKYSARSRERDWLVSAENILYKLTTGPIGRMLNAPGKMPLREIMDKPVIFELDRLGSESDRAFFIQTFLLWLYYYRLAEGKSKLFKHAIIIEEAHHMFLRRNGSPSIHDMMIRQMRDLGQSLILLDQNPSLLSVPALGNTGTTICLNLKHGDDVKAAGKALTIPPKNWDDIGRLPVGHAIVKVQGRWPKPFLVQFPYFPVLSHDTSLPRERKNIPGDSLQGIAEELRSALTEAVRALPGTDRQKKEDEEIGDMARKLLTDIAKHPLSNVTQRYHRLGWSAHTGTKIKHMLLERKFIEQEKVATPDGSVVLLRPTAKGRDLLVSWGIKSGVSPKNASLTHEYYKERIAGHYETLGYRVRKEVHVKEGQHVDLVASKDNIRIGIEVETGKSNVVHNIRKCLDAGFDEIHVVTMSRDTHRKIAASLAPLRDHNIHLMTIHDLLLSARTALFKRNI